MRLSEQVGIVPIIEPENHQSAGITGDSVNMKDYGHVTFIFLFGELTGNSVLKIHEAASAGGTTADMTFAYRYTGADLLNDDADAYSDETTSAALTLTAATYEDRVLVVEIDATEMTDGYDWLTPVIDSTASELFVSCVAIMSKPRYAKNDMPTAVA